MNTISFKQLRFVTARDSPSKSYLRWLLFKFRIQSNSHNGTLELLFLKSEIVKLPLVVCQQESFIYSAFFDLDGLNLLKFGADVRTFLQLYVSVISIGRVCSVSVIKLTKKFNWTQPFA
ncbi:hypothetical protein Csa_008892, partial [Cucumis sativus]